MFLINLLILFINFIDLPKMQKILLADLPAVFCLIFPENSRFI